MTDDIVTRLRIIHCAKGDVEHCGTCLPCQAADEIERLRAQLKVFQAERDHHQKWSKNYEQEIYKLRDQIKKKNSN